MAQHFLLSAASRTLSLRSIYKAGEDAAYNVFCEMRWPETNGEAVCPRCSHGETYSISTRRKFKCKNCHHQFSVTSGTIFASRKMDFVDLLAAICILVNASKGVSMIQLSRDLDCQYKTAFVLAHKLREAMAQEVQTGEVLEGHVEIDGAYFGGHIRPENRKEDRKDRRLKENQTGKRRVVVALREREGRTLPFVTKLESEGVALANENVCRMATVSADEASHWDMLHNGWDVQRVNHSQVYSDHGKHTNLVESFFSRLRRMVQGQHHHVSPQYLYQYANHAAWLEDNRRKDNGALASALITNAMDAPVSRRWKGYWQRAA
ncbi:putative transposase [Dinoroseobacter shibae DFL 12 = DSM 16493]|jgi:transposase-like protein|uniref:Putative transposase n=1 Tax=Dinoroseobacter shibae (strain DSM 16493 / NCIMB 14021 / DFL 12) TaxID=398580 RepID=A8LJX1_DINSH|nr:IS1595-like element ISDsh3 family transposase [Dinoroseobacter shibae]ABV91797.1 putative transposase [Dinoroseobacter shibae DFL 12 = DSM 16493]URF46778.1 IS1595-like element ISDsh3 family transposase [Dinoroseobacter shibae]URF51089.1 IS1595-like element ISDsh3 family transposase [Dinoroseobacter shibae]